MLSQLSPAERVERVGRVLASRWRKPSEGLWILSTERQQAGLHVAGGLPNILLSSEIITINTHMLLVVFNDSNNSNTIFI